MLGQGDWIGFTVLRRRSFRFRLHASLATWREGEGRSPWHKMQACHYQPQEMGYEFAPPRGAGLGHWPRVPRGSYSHLGLCRPLAPYPRRQGTSLIVGWASQWGLVESKRIADGIPVIHQHE